MKKPFKKQFQRLIYKNEAIKAPHIMIIDLEKNNLGTLPRRKALEMANEKGLDLIQLSYDKDKMISTVIMADYGKYAYNKQKEEKEKRKQQKAQSMKEIKLSYTIGQNDLDMKINRVKEFLAKGITVKISIRLKGRENIYKNKAKQKLLDIMEELTDISRTQYNTPKHEGSGFSIILFSKSS